MKYGVVLFPGSNCDQDSYYAVDEVMGQEVDYIWHGDKKQLNQYDCIILPGGFSYGDYLRVGAIARFSTIIEEVIAFANRGGFVIGICNGFQILLEANLLPGVMLQNQSIHFVCKQLFIKTINSDTPFTNQLKQNDILNIPIAHMDGNYYCADETYKKLWDNNQVIFQYCSSTGMVDDSSNPNGSKKNIAGICNVKKNVFGLMPHPERAMEKIIGSVDGKKIFKSIEAVVNNVD